MSCWHSVDYGHNSNCSKVEVSFPGLQAKYCQLPFNPISRANFPKSRKGSEEQGTNEEANIAGLYSDAILKSFTQENHTGTRFEFLQTSEFQHTIQFVASEH